MESNGELVSLAQLGVQNFQGNRLQAVRTTVPVVVLKVKGSGSSSDKQCLMATACGLQGSKPFAAVARYAKMLGFQERLRSAVHVRDSRRYAVGLRTGDPARG